MSGKGQCREEVQTAKVRRKRQAGTRSPRGDLVKSSDLLEVQWAERH